MLLRSMLIVGMLTAVGCAAGASDGANLQGTWKVERGEEGGKSKLKDEPINIVIQGDLMEIQGGGPRETVRFTLNSTTKPKSIDLQTPGSATPGIYELDGETLRLCWARGEGERPTEFASKPEDEQIVLLVCKRESRAGVVAGKAPPPTGDGKGAASTPRDQGEVSLERYKDQAVLLIAAPSKDDPAYKKFDKDWRNIEGKTRELGLTVIELFGDASGNERGGPALDKKSVEWLVGQHVPDRQKFTVAVLAGAQGKATRSKSGTVDVRKFVEDLLKN